MKRWTYVWVDKFRWTNGCVDKCLGRQMKKLKKKIMWTNVEADQFSGERMYWRTPF